MVLRVALTLLLLVTPAALADAAAAPAPAGPARVIFDTDMDSDCDDVGALGMLHALADLGECEILATVVSSRSEGAAACVDAINTAYGRGDLPIGEPKGPGAVRSASKYAKQLAKRFPGDLKPGDPVPDAMDVYRAVLSNQPDGGVTVVTVGDLTNIASLLKLPAKGGQPGGTELVKRTVAKWVCMGGNFIGRPAKDDLKLGNNNFTLDKASSHYAVHHWPVELVFVGREVGSVPSGLKAGARLKDLPETNPIRFGYAAYFGGEPKDRHLADQTTVLYAVRGMRDYWDIEADGFMDLKPDMTFEWRAGGGDRKHNYLLKRSANGKHNDRAIETVIEDLMTRPPARASRNGD